MDLSARLTSSARHTSSSWLNLASASRRERSIRRRRLERSRQPARESPAGQVGGGACAAGASVSGRQASRPAGRRRLQTERRTLAVGLAKSGRAARHEPPAPPLRHLSRKSHPQPQPSERPLVAPRPNSRTHARTHKHAHKNNNNNNTKTTQKQQQQHARLDSHNRISHRSSSRPGGCVTAARASLPARARRRRRQLSRRLQRQPIWSVGFSFVFVLSGLCGAPVHSHNDCSNQQH